MTAKKEKFISMRIPASVLEALKAKAESEMRTFSSQILFYIVRGLEEDSKK